MKIIWLLIFPEVVALMFAFVVNIDHCWSWFNLPLGYLSLSIMFTRPNRIGWARPSECLPGGWMYAQWGWLPTRKEIHGFRMLGVEFYRVQED